MRPLIAVTGPYRGAFAARRLVQLALHAAGGFAIQVRPGDNLSVEPFDGVVVTGGHDIDPVLYAQESAVRPRYDRERDAFESAMIDQAIEQRRPVLGICRGAQLLNVRLGGDLHQDLGAHRRRRHRRSLLPLKRVTIRDDTLLRGIVGAPSIGVNDLHRQGIARLGEGLIVSARDADGIVQAIEHPDHRCVIGTQWHPEFLLHAPCQRRLFRALVNAARCDHLAGSLGPARDRC